MDTLHPSIFHTFQKTPMWQLWVDVYLQDREEMIKLLKQQLHKAQNRMKLQADRNRTERSFAIGDWVYLKLQPYKQQSIASRGNHKLSSKYFGPFQVVDKVGPVAYTLQLPLTAMIHPTFHVSQLKMASSTHPFTPLPAFVNHLTTYQPQAVLDRRMVKRGNTAAAQLLIHWKDLAPSDATWEFASDIRARFPWFSLEDKGFEEGGIAIEL